MGILSSVPFFSAGGSVLGVTFSLLSVAIILALWVLVLLILHPLHATLFLLAAFIEYSVISYFGFDLWPDFFIFFSSYIILFALYNLCLKRLLPLPKTQAEQLIRLAELKKEDLLSEEEYKVAKKRLLKL